MQTPTSPEPGKHKPMRAQRYGTWRDGAAHFGVSIRSLQRRAAEGKIVTVKLGGRPLIDFVATEELLHQS